MTDTGLPPSAPGRGRLSVLAFAWGLAEAVIFFIAPDVLFTRLALRDVRSALVACCWGTVGTVAGGALVWYGGTIDAPSWLHAFERLPGINRGLTHLAGGTLAENGLSAVVTGTLTGTPYKLFAAHAGAQSVSLLPFLAISAGARLVRFVAGAVIMGLISRVLHESSWTFRARAHAMAWFTFYAIYFLVMR